MNNTTPSKLDGIGGQHDNYPCESSRGTLAHLRAKTGFFQAVGSNFAISAEAGKGIRKIERAQIRAHVEVSGHATDIAKAQMITAIVNAAIPVFNGMVGQLNASTDAANQSLSEQEAAVIQSHLHSREQTRADIDRIGRQRELSNEEIIACKSFADANVAQDIGSARERTQAGKRANENLYDRAMGSLMATTLPNPDR